MLTGTSVPIVFEEAREDFKWIKAGTDRLFKVALDAFEKADGISVFNPAPVESDSIVFSEDYAGSQTVEGGSLTSLYPVAAYGSAPLVNCKKPDTVNLEQRGSSFILANELIEVEVSSAGDVVSITDRVLGRAVLESGQHGNQLWAYEDRPLSWDAWDIDVFHDDRAERIENAESVEILERGPLRCAVRIRYKYRSSTIAQTIRVIAGSPRIEFKTEANWQERHILLKTLFPVDVLSPRATYEIQWGEIERSTHRNTRWDFAQFEVPAQKWVDLSEGGFGVALLNDCKHGHRIHENRIHLTLIKSSTNPDPGADLGHHEFTYALMPHNGDLATVRAEARRLNNPVRLVDVQMPSTPLAKCDANNVIIETIKPAEDGNGFIIRLYEAARRRGVVKLEFGLNIKSVTNCDLLENPISELSHTDRSVEFMLKPFEIVTLRCVPDSGVRHG